MNENHQDGGLLTIEHTIGNFSTESGNTLNLESLKKFNNERQWLKASCF
ncbi:hypothetical protein RV06_GL002308 [Enterococcus haemoperoxidus]|nr:hypothetical protein RV06_GL002308 [Enterococcus haemoperoxidus]